MIENASDSDMGSYECMAKSPAGEVKSRSVHMKMSTSGTTTPSSQPRGVYSDPLTLNERRSPIALFASEAEVRPTARGRRRRGRICGPTQLPSHRPPEARRFVDVQRRTCGSSTHRYPTSLDPIATS